MNLFIRFPPKLIVMRGMATLCLQLKVIKPIVGFHLVLVVNLVALRNNRSCVLPPNKMVLVDFPPYSARGMAGVIRRSFNYDVFTLLHWAGCFAY